VDSVITGLFVQTETGTLAPRIQDSGEDTLFVVGTARLAGAYAPAFYTGDLQRSYELFVLDGESTGSFTTLAPTGLADFVDASLDYTAQGVDLLLTADIAGVPGLTANEAAVAGALDSAFNDGDGIGDELNAAFFALSADQVPGALDAQSGEIYASTQAVLIGDQSLAREAVLGRLRQAINGVSADGFGGPRMNFIAPVAPGVDRVVTFWGQALGARSTYDGGSGVSEAKSNFGGIFGGADMSVGSNGVVGLAAGYSQSDTSVDALNSSADADSYLIAVYGGAEVGAWNFRGGASYATGSVETRRTVSFPGYTDTTSADYDTNISQLFGEVGYGVVTQGVEFEPFFGLAMVHLDTDGFTESGGDAALSGNGSSSDYGTTTVGLRAATSYPMANGTIVSPRVSAAWQRAFGDLSTGATLAYADAGGDGFTVNGVGLTRDTALVDAGIDIQVSQKAVVGVSYFGQLAKDGSNNALRANITWTF
jgi:outer membrane autotransporter protein